MGMNFNGLSAEVEISGNINAIPVPQTPSISKTIAGGNTGLNVVHYTVPANTKIHVMGIYINHTSTASVTHYMRNSGGTSLSTARLLCVANTISSLMPSVPLQTLEAGGTLNSSGTSGSESYFVIIEEAV